MQPASACVFSGAGEQGIVPKLLVYQSPGVSDLDEGWLKLLLGIKKILTKPKRIYS